jgi:thiamine transport system substrate-binding protein
MKKVCLFILTALVIMPLFSLGRSDSGQNPDSHVAAVITENQSKTLTVYCYDSFASDWGAGPTIIENFEALYGVNVILEAPGDAVTVMSQAIMEKNNPRGDVIIGLDNNLLNRVLSEDLLISYRPSALNNMDSRLIFDDSYHLIPYDWGFFAICYDSEVINDPPTSLNDLLDSRFKDSLVVMDPRTSTPGMGFLLWTIEVLGEEGWKDYWKKLDSTLLTISDGWSSGYGLFTEGEASLVLSYSTSPVYHVEWEDTTRYRSLIFDEGNYIQIEGMGILKGTENLELAKKFIDFMLTEDSQVTLAMSNIMFPVIKDTPLPQSFDYALKSDNIIMTDGDLIEDNSERWIQEWVETVSQ